MGIIQIIYFQYLKLLNKFIFKSTMKMEIKVLRNHIYWFDQTSL